MRFAVLTTVFLAGCASASPAKFSHSTADDRTYTRDRYACLQEARGQYAEGNRAGFESKPVVSGPLFRSCMANKGYKLDPNGRFAPPPGTEAVTVD